MGVYEFRLPDIGEGVAEAEIVAWHVKPGDRVKEDQSLVDVMTDKATVDISSPVTGVAIAVFGEVGKKLPVGSVLIELEVEGAGNAAAPNAEPKPVIASALKHTTPAAASAAAAAPLAAPIADVPMRSAAQGPFAAPATRRRAHQLGIPLQYVTGTGPAAGSGEIHRRTRDGESRTGRSGEGQEDRCRQHAHHWLAAANCREDVGVEASHSAYHLRRGM